MTVKGRKSGKDPGSRGANGAFATLHICGRRGEGRRMYSPSTSLLEGKESMIEGEGKF
jgi:hypothetical protein